MPARSFAMSPDDTLESARCMKYLLASSEWRPSAFRSFFRNIPASELASLIDWTIDLIDSVDGDLAAFQGEWAAMIEDVPLERREALEAVLLETSIHVRSFQGGVNAKGHRMGSRRLRITPSWADRLRVRRVFE
jgi:hypothetical protein